MDSPKFTGKEGQLISAEKALAITEPYQRREQEIALRGENYVKAEFFGIHTFNELIRSHGDNCVGFRMYYGLTDEDEELFDKTSVLGRAAKKPTSRLVLVPVDAYGNDLIRSAQLGGLKDMSAQKEVMTGGPLCPSHC
jgi:hypothetical protein